MGMLYEYSKAERAIITGVEEDVDGYQPGDINPDEPTFACDTPWPAETSLTEEELTQKERMRDKHGDLATYYEQLRELEG